MTYFINKKIINNSFTKAANDEYFVDKTVLISKINTVINKKDRFLMSGSWCVSCEKSFFLNF